MRRGRGAAIAIAIVAIAGLSVGGSAGTGERQVEVRAGETLSAIAAREGVSVTALAQANGISNPNRVVAGRTLTIPSAAAAVPASTTHTVVAGETLSAIAARYGTTASAVATVNNIKNANIVVIGRTLTIPAGAAATGLPSKLLANPDRLALRPTFTKWATKNGIPVDLLEGLSWVESGWQAGVVSSTGAVGIGQLMPATTEHMRLLIGVPTLDPFNAEDNIRMSARMMRFLLNQTGGDLRLALGSYYQGLRSVRETGFLPETELYIATVLAARSRFR